MKLKNLQSLFQNHKIPLSAIPCLQYRKAIDKTLDKIAETKVEDCTRVIGIIYMKRFLCSKNRLITTVFNLYTISFASSHVTILQEIYEFPLQKSKLCMIINEVSHWMRRKLENIVKNYSNIRKFL